MRRKSALAFDTALVGSGISGALVAREMLTRGDAEIGMIERGERISWVEQTKRAPDGTPPFVEAASPPSAHNDESGPEGVDWTWEYVYAVGGSANHWIGTCPRFLPEDFELRSRYGVLRDWPLSYDELAPWYDEAERALGVAGPRSEIWPGSTPPLPPHPLSPQDRAIAPHLGPFVALPQARPSRPVNSQPACCGSARCELCPVDSRFSVLNGLGATLEDRRLNLTTGMAAARLVPSASGKRVDRLECVDAAGEMVTVRARRFVIAANAIESAGLLLRSGLDDGDAGRFFCSRPATTLLLETSKAIGVGHGASRSTGASYAYYAGANRARRAAALLVPENLGAAQPMLAAMVDGLLDRKPGTEVRRAAVGRWERTLALTAIVEEEPRRENAVTLSPTRDALGLPLNRVTYRPGRYETEALAALREDLPRRLRPLGAQSAAIVTQPRASHLLGTLRMGSVDGVVDRDLRHRRLENLYLVGGSVFPTTSGTHPTLTIAALALRLGQELARE